ncbi:uncharacterized protein [Bemisia tabaci]|uniref:uncharacterized protein n=1 Tax=Bemisia tabaci TaxID=7038 RepID=UPI003B288155
MGDCSVTGLAILRTPAGNPCLKGAMDMVTGFKAYEPPMEGADWALSRSEGSQSTRAYSEFKRWSSSGVSKDQRAQQGVAILVRNDLRKCITSWEPINERIVKMNVTVYGHKITLLGVYGINDDAPVAAKDQFFELLNDEILKVGTSREVIVIGDLNGRTGRRIGCKVVGPFGEDVVNDNGNRIIEVCEQNELKILNGFFQHRDIHKYTWVQRTRDLRSIIDYAITNQTTKIKVQQVKVCRGLSCGSDHHFLKIEIAFPVKSFPHSVPQQQQQQQGEKVQPVRYNIDSLHHQSVKDLYRKRLNEKLDEKQDFCDAEDQYQFIKTCIHAAAREALGVREKITTECKPYWWDKEIEEEIDAKRRKYHSFLHSKSDEDKIAYKHAQAKGEEVPKEWKESWISAKHKKGKKDDCENYRGLSVVGTVSKIYGKILEAKIEEEWAPYEAEEQAGFRAGRSTVDHLFCITQLVEKKMAVGQELHLVFVDLQKAYDSVPLVKLWEALKKSNFSDGLVNAIKKYYCGSFTRIKCQGRLSGGFYVSKGLKQGCCLSPTLFKIFLEHVLKEWKKKCSGMGVPLNDTDTLYTLCFADDQVVIAQDADDAEYMTRKLVLEYRRWGLEVSVKKTEKLTIGGDQQDIELEDGQCIKSCEHYKYLGVRVSQDGKMDQAIKDRNLQGRKAIAMLNRILWDQSADGAGYRFDTSRRILGTEAGADAWRPARLLQPASTFSGGAVADGESPSSQTSTVEPTAAALGRSQIANSGTDLFPKIRVPLPGKYGRLENLEVRFDQFV